MWVKKTQVKKKELFESSEGSVGVVRPGETSGWF